MPFKPRELEKLLQTKFGFVPATSHSSDHRWYKLNLPNLPPIFTKFSHGKKEIGSSLEAKIARQLKVRKPFFDGMFQCTKNRQDYYQQVQKDPFPPF